MTYHQLIKKYQQKAIKAKRESEAIRLLVLELSNYDGASFLAHYHDEIEEEQCQSIIKALDQYIIHQIPPQYILGYSYFYGYRFIVDPNVLIPRPETEELVGLVLSYYDEMFAKEKVRVADIGTGSGNIAITLKKEEPSFEVYGVDICPKALAVATRNAANLQTTVTFLEGDMVEPLKKCNVLFDIVVANPPYIPNDEEVQELVLNNEPHLALFGGVDGLKFYEEILKNCHDLLASKALLAFEHSYSKRQAMVDLAKKYFPSAKVTSLKDIRGCDRFTIIQKVGE